MMTGNNEHINTRFRNQYSINVLSAPPIGHIREDLISNWDIFEVLAIPELNSNLYFQVHELGWV